MIFYPYIIPFFLGLIQGVTEFLPISSSGHLVLIQHFLLTKPDLLSLLVLHLGTLMAILSFYKKELILLCKSPHKKWIYLLATSLLPTLFGALLIRPFIEQNLHSIKGAGFGFLLTGFYLLSIRMRGKKVFNTQETTQHYGPFVISGFQALMIGLSQMLALFPGVSRAGLTITTGLFLKIPQKQASFFSFLLAVPTILGAMLWEVSDLSYESPVPIHQLVVAFFTAWGVGHVALKYLIRSLQNHSFYLFAFYLCPLGLGILIKEWWFF